MEHYSKPRAKDERKVSFCITYRNQANAIVTVRMFKSIIHCTRPIDALSSCYNLAIEITKKVEWLCYEPAIYNGIVKNYTQLGGSKEILKWEALLQDNQNITIFLIDSKSMFRIMPILEYLKDNLVSNINYQDIIKHMLSYMKSTGEYSYLEACTDGILHSFYNAHVGRDMINKERKDISRCLYILRQIEYAKISPIGNLQRVVIYIPNCIENSSKDMRISFNLHRHCIPLNLYWLCYDMALDIGINLMLYLCTIHGSNSIYLRGTIIIPYCEVIELKYVTYNLERLPDHLQSLRDVCVWSTQHRNRVPMIDYYIKQLSCIQL